MKRKNIILGVMIILLFSVLVGACNKTKDSDKEKKTKKTITASDVIDKVVKKYESMNVSDIKVETEATLKSAEDKSMNAAVVIHNSFVDNDINKCITKFNLKLNVDKKENLIDLYINEQGNIVYSLNKSDYYSADEIYSMLGINYSAPKLETEEDDNSSKDEENNSTEEPTASAEVSETDNNTSSTAVSTTPTPRKVYTMSDLKNLSKNVSLKGNKEINGQDCYILKGKLQGVVISNFLTKNLTEGLYEIPKEFGNIDYEIYVNKSTYEISNIMLDCNELVSTLSGREKREDNIVNVNITYNTGEKIEFPKGKEFELEKYSDILNLVGQITIGLRDMKAE